MSRRWKFLNGIFVPPRLGFVGGPAIGFLAKGQTGPNAWFDINTTSNTTAALGANTEQHENISVAQGGTATKIRIYIGSFSSAGDVKAALYNGSNVLISGAPLVTVTGTGYVEFVLTTPSVITAGTYRIASINSGGSFQFAYNSTTGSSFRYDSLTYSAFPASTLVTGSTLTTRSYRWGLFVQ